MIHHDSGFGVCFSIFLGVAKNLAMSPALAARLPLPRNDALASAPGCAMADGFFGAPWSSNGVLNFLVLSREWGLLGLLLIAIVDHSLIPC